MILVTGGFAAGKRSYTREALGYKDIQMAGAGEIWQSDAIRVVYDAQELAQAEPRQEILDDLCRKDVVITCEVGAGIVPIDRDERLYREAAGRLNVLLAQRADKVIRVVCGLPQVLKDSQG